MMLNTAVITVILLVCLTSGTVLLNSEDSSKHHVQCISAGDNCDSSYVIFHQPSSSYWPPVILSAPHGGSLSPPSIPDRDAGCWNETSSRCLWNHHCGLKNPTKCRPQNDGDFHTFELAIEVRDNLCKLFSGNCPAVVLNNLVRAKFDANRPEEEATFGVPEVEAAFDTYNAHIDQTKDMIVKRHGHGLFIDIHGHGHSLQRAELGYLIRGSELDSGRTLNPNLTSIRSLAAAQATTYFDSLIRGTDSFGAFLEEYGFQAVPSPTNRGPSGQLYFNGGYLTRRHGSLVNGTFDAIQIESPRTFRNASTRPRYAEALANTIHKYICIYYTAQQEVSGGVASGSVGENVIGNGEECISAWSRVSALLFVMMVVVQWAFVQY